MDLRLHYRLHAPSRSSSTTPWRLCAEAGLESEVSDDDHLRRSMSPQPLLEKPEPEAHLVQFYEADEHVLTQNVGRYLLEGLKLDEGLLVTAVKEHADP